MLNFLVRGLTGSDRPTLLDTQEQAKTHSDGSN